MKTGVQTIIQKINEDSGNHSRERYEQIKNDVNEEIENENKFYQQELDKRHDMLKKHNAQEQERVLERLDSRLNRELLTYKQQLLDEIFDEAVAKLRMISNTEFFELFQAVVKGIRGSFYLSLGEFSEHQLDAAAIDAALKEKDDLEIILKTETIPQKSGFLLENSRVEYNCLFEDLMEDKKTEQASVIFQEVFMAADGDCLSK